MDQKKFCSECNVGARYLGLTSAPLAESSARQKYSSSFEILLLLSDKRNVALHPVPSLLLWDSRVQAKGSPTEWPAFLHISGLSPCGLLPYCYYRNTSFVNNSDADNSALWHHSLSDSQKTSLAFVFQHSQMCLR